MTNLLLTKSSCPKRHAVVSTTLILDGFYVCHTDLSGGEGVLNTHPYPLWHGVGQLLEEGHRQVLHPHHLDNPDEEGQGTDAAKVPLQLCLHDAPDIFNGHQV